MITSVNYQSLNIWRVGRRQLTLANTRTRRIQQQRPVSYETGPKGGPGRDLRGWISLKIEVHTQWHN